MKLLLVEDEIRMADALTELLRQDGYDTDCFYRGDEGLEAIRTNVYDCAILDVMLPEISGYTIASLARQAGIRTPILMLSAKSELDDKVNGLDSGADDYLTKPFQPRELLARVRALCRRAVSSVDGEISLGDLRLNSSTLMLSCTSNGQNIRLSDKEYKILEFFAGNPGRILTKEQLAVKIWGYENEAEYNKVEVYISFTRKKLAFVNSRLEIKAVRGVGYELR